MLAQIVQVSLKYRGFVNASVFVLGNTAEPFIVTELIWGYIGPDFRLDRLRHVIALVAAALAGCAVMAAGWAVVLRYSAALPVLTTWRDLVINDSIGVVLVAPFVIGVLTAARQPQPLSELLKGITGVALLIVVTIIIILLPPELWNKVVPVVWLFPFLLWIAAQCPPFFSAVAVFLVSMIIISTTIHGVGYFGDMTRPIEDRSVQAIWVTLFVTYCGLVLAALFAERRESEARLVRANMLLERERDSKLMNVQAALASMAHEVKRPLAAIATNASAALRWLARTPPDCGEARAALNMIKGEGHRTSEVFDGIRALFGKVDTGLQTIDINEIIISVNDSLQRDLKERGVTVRSELTKLPPVKGHRGQLREVIFNLVNNALEAMDTVSHRNRVLQATTELRGRDAIVVSVQDSGPGIDPKRLDSIFAAFLTTKAHGTGLGLAICRMIIERHGGQLNASSDGRNGALFQFVLPIEPSP
jgi:signal transduction histidine kinase